MHVASLRPHKPTRARCPSLAEHQRDLVVTLAKLTRQRLLTRVRVDNRVGVPIAAARERRATLDRLLPEREVRSRLVRYLLGAPSRRWTYHGVAMPELPQDARLGPSKIEALVAHHKLHDR
eukprot:scaffold96961_cov71-Phaeocystis_antarctica.AAC.3